MKTHPKTVNIFLSLFLLSKKKKKKKIEANVIELNSVRFGCLLLESQYSREKCWLEKDRLFYRRPGTWEKGTLVKQIQKILLNHEKFLKEIHWVGMWEGW